MAEKPILFSGPMVRAILEGRKTQTRRIIKDKVQMSTLTDYLRLWKNEDEEIEPRFRVGDRLWVRETWADTNGESGPMISYRAGGDRFLIDDSYPVDYSRYTGCKFTMWCGDLRRGAEGHSWRPSIFMPRWASRITLEVTGVRAQRLQDISEEDAIAEGSQQPMPDMKPPMQACWTERQAFKQIWDSINGKTNGAAWADNPWVWAYEFREVEGGASA